MCLIFSSGLKSQETDSIKPNANNRNEFVQKKNDVFNFKFSFYNLDQEFKIAGDNFHYNIKPNFTLKTRFFINYKFISAALTLSPKFIPWNKDSDLKGDTKSFTFNLNLYLDHFCQELQYNKTKGFYLGNTVDFIPTWIEGKDPYILFPNLELKAFRGATSYIFNSNYSIKAARTQTEIQKKSAGTFMPSVVYRYYTITNNTGVIPSNHQNSKNFETVLSVWYMHTFVFKQNWYFTFGVAPAAGYSYTKLETYSENNIATEHYNEPVFRLNEQAGFGANFNRFFTGFYIYASQTREKQGNNPVIQKNFYTTFQIFAGYRFTAPKFLHKL